MKRHACILSVLMPLLLAFAMQGQDSSGSSTASVPRVVRFSGTLRDGEGKPLSGIVGVTLALYSEQTGGTPLFLETQNVLADTSGHYAVVLGATKPDGLPLDLFTFGTARWLGVQPEGQAERARVLLVSAPYALKAGDAETIGGLPPSAFVLAAPAAGASTNAASNASAAPPASAVTGTGTVNFLPIWTGSSTIGNSVLFQSGSGSSAKVGINSSTPAATLDVGGTTNLRGTLILPATGRASATGGKNSEAETLAASSYNSGTKVAVSQTFQWQAEAVRNNSTSPSGTLNLLFGSGTSKPTETGLFIANNGQITFATGQTFPGTGNGTITGVTAGTDLTGGGTSGTITLNLDTTKVPQFNANNTFNGNQTINGTITAVPGPSSTAILGLTGTATAVQGQSTSGTGVVGASSSSVGVYGLSDSSDGVYGFTKGTNFTGDGVTGIWNTSSNIGLGLNTMAGVRGDSSTGTGVYGLSDISVGVWGHSAQQTGVVGESSTGFGVFASTGPSSYGVFGEGGTGVYGTNGGVSSIGAGRNASVWGDVSSGHAILATTDFGEAIHAYNQTDSAYTFVAENDTTDGNGSMGIFTAPANPNNNFQNYCYIAANGDLVCTGSKSAAVPVSGKRMVRLYAVESPENWFEDFGSAQLNSGVAHVDLESAFAETVSGSSDYHVFLTPRGDCQGLYVSAEAPSGFEVHELHGGRSSVAFDYRVVAHRKGYENIRMEDITERITRMEANQKKLETRTAKPPNREFRHMPIVPQKPQKPAAMTLPLPPRLPRPAVPAAPRTTGSPTPGASPNETG